MEYVARRCGISCSVASFKRHLDGNAKLCMRGRQGKAGAGNTAAFTAGGAAKMTRAVS